MHLPYYLVRRPQAKIALVFTTNFLHYPLVPGCRITLGNDGGGAKPQVAAAALKDDQRWWWWCTLPKNLGMAGTI